MTVHDRMSAIHHCCVAMEWNVILRSISFNELKLYGLKCQEEILISCVLNHILEQWLFIRLSSRIQFSINKCNHIPYDICTAIGIEIRISRSRKELLLFNGFMLYSFTVYSTSILCISYVNGIDWSKDIYLCTCLYIPTSEYSYENKK